MDENDRNEGNVPDDQLTLGYGGSALGPGAQIRRYKLLRILGEGGYGIVYLAEQQRPVKRRVALKLIKPGMDTKQVIARFEAERQALALLDHPNIAHVFNAGTTEAGHPYFVMEYVKGVPITEHCDRYKLTIEERLKMFLAVCEAIQHAHQKAIIHRDIKPSNILVAYEGEQAIPMIIDFGVAKALGQSLTERTLVTEQAQMIGTPEYMSPEQAEMTGQDIDTRTDIYSLGVLLYELLTGILPFDSKTLREGGAEHMRRMIREQDPQTPSARLSAIESETSINLAEHRRTDIRTLGHCLHGELDWITLKAMDKDRTRRYQTAHALAEDIQRYLNCEPVLAGPPSVMYHINKFIYKHRTKAIAAAFTTVLIVCIAIITLMYVHAVERSEEAEALKHKEILSKAMELRSSGQYQEALTRIETIIDSKHVGPEARLLRARTILRSEDLNEAISQLEELTHEQDEIACQAHFLLTRIYLETDPGDSETREDYQQKGRAHQKMGEELFSKSAEAYFNRSMMAGTVIKTLEWLNKAIDLDPGHYDSREARALAYNTLKKYDEMEEDATVMVALEPSHSKGYALRAIARREIAKQEEEKKFLDAAMKDHNKAIELSPAEPKLYDQRRRTYMAIGNYQQVLLDAQKCVELAPNKSVYHFHVFCALVALGHYEDAQEIYNTIIELDLLERDNLDLLSAKYVSDTLDAGLSWHPSESIPEGIAFLAMHESDEIYHQLARKAERVVAEGFHPTWSPDGMELAYSCGILGSSGIEVLNVRSGKTRLLTVPGIDPAWSPDGRYIAFSRGQRTLLLADIAAAEREAEMVPPVGGGIWLIKADGTENPRFLVRGFWPRWNSDSKCVFYLRNQLYSITIEPNAKPKPIFRYLSGGPGLYGLYAVSPDDKYLAYVYGYGEGIQIVELTSESVVANCSIGPLQRGRMTLTWSPNGQELIISSFYDSGLWIYDVKKKEISKILSGSFEQCSWSRPDMSRMAIGRTYEDLRHEIWIADAETLKPGRTLEVHYEEMVNFYNHRIATDPESAENYLNRAMFNIYLQDSKKAIADLEKHTDIMKDPLGLFSVYDTLIWPLVSKEQQMVHPEVTVELYRKAHETNTEDWWYLFGLGMAHYRAGQWEQSIDALTKSTRLPGGKNTWTFLLLSMAHWQSGNKETAVKWYNRTVQVGKGYFDTLERRKPYLYHLYSEAVELMGIRPKEFGREEPLTGKLISPIMVRSQSSHPDMSVSLIIDGTGLTDGDADGLIEHDENPEHMWLGEAEKMREWIEFDLGGVYELGSTLVWNYNERGQTDRGIMKADIAVLTPKGNWEKIYSDYEFTKAEGSFDYDEPVHVRFNEVKARKVRFDDLVNFGDEQYVGLSEIRFYQRRGPEAIRPYPADGTNIGSLVDAKLSWIAGLGIDAYEVYLSTSPDSLKKISRVPAEDESEVKLPRLEMHQEYFWRVDAQNPDGSVIKGTLWSFLTGELVAWWKFDDGGGSTAADSSGNNYAGTLIGGPQWVAGNIDGGLQFDGTDDYVELPIGSLIGSLTNSTFATWVNFSNAGGMWQRIFDFGNDMICYMFLTLIETTGPMRFSITLGGYDADVVATASDTLTSGWHHVTVTIDADNRVITLYLDGSVVAQNDQAMLNPSDLGETTNNWLGRSQYPDDAYFQGVFDDFRIYSYVLNQAEIKALYMEKDTVSAKN